MRAGLRTKDYEYDLPAGLIAQSPAAERDQSRLLVAHRASQRLEHRRFTDLAEYLREGDVLALNDSRVIPARLRGRNEETGGRFEILLVEEAAPNHWWVLARPARRARPGTKIAILSVNHRPSGVTATVEEIGAGGRRRLRFGGVENILTALDALGETPLPPYIRREVPLPEDRERYQTVYAGPPGSVAAPTAGLHFTGETLARIRAAGVKTCFVTLHVGPGTFAPVKTDLVAEHRMHEERFEISAEAARAVTEAKSRGGRVVAVGTTTLRVLEGAAAARPGGIAPGGGATSLFIHPPFDFKIVDALLTNFHLPRSSLLMLVSAFASPGGTEGREFVLRAYREAVERGYRFFSYGDAMLVD
ncbi:MAG: tRNA preQ1(34) S-adenosylmethionine ribosyltransferase-isomerase QueA [Verrucomicrobiota bacterium]|jgi:S-adenosylmethionine:tRNA ribosyltransferase-isomerase